SPYSASSNIKPPMSSALASRWAFAAWSFSSLALAVSYRSARPLYARVSSGKDAMRHSLSAQVSYYSALIQKHTGWLYCGVYADEAFTGTKDSRDGFQSLL